MARSSAVATAISCVLPDWDVPGRFAQTRRAACRLAYAGEYPGAACLRTRTATGSPPPPGGLPAIPAMPSSSSACSPGTIAALAAWNARTTLERTCHISPLHACSPTPAAAAHSPQPSYALAASRDLPTCACGLNASTRYDATWRERRKAAFLLFARHRACALWARLLDKTPAALYFPCRSLPLALLADARIPFPLTY